MTEMYRIYTTLCVNSMCDIALSKAFSDNTMSYIIIYYVAKVRSPSNDVHVLIESLKRHDSFHLRSLWKILSDFLWRGRWVKPPPRQDDYRASSFFSPLPFSFSGDGFVAAGGRCPGLGFVASGGRCPGRGSFSCRSGPLCGVPGATC